MHSSKRNLFFGSVVILAALGIFAVLGGCGSADVDPGATASESASELVTSSINGAVSSASDGGTGALAYNQLEERSLLNRSLDQIFSSENAWATTSCPTIAASISGCVAATGMPVVLTTCNYIKPDAANYYPGVWNGTINYKFAAGTDMTGTAYCPTGGPTAFPLVANATPGTPIPGDRRPVTMLRTLTNVTKTSADGKSVVTIDTTTASGWDTAVGLKSGGLQVSFYPNASAIARAVIMNGTHYTATRSYVTKKNMAKTATIWDHTVSGNMNIAVSGTGFSVHTSTGTVVLQHNLAKYTATATLTGVVHDHLSCGCLPKAGTIATTFTGSKTGSETLTITGCGTGTLVDTTGASSTVTMTHCQ